MEYTLEVSGQLRSMRTGVLALALAFVLLCYAVLRCVVSNN